MVGIRALVKKGQLQDAASEDSAISGDSAEREVQPADLDEKELAAAYVLGRATFADLDLDAARFSSHLRLVVARLGAGNTLDGLMIEDLYLACACLERVPGAVEALLKRHGGVIRAAIAPIAPEADRSEIEQHLLDGLLVGSAGSPPKLASYSGKAPIGRWLQVSAQRAALMSLRSGDVEARAREGAGAQPLASVMGIESSYLKERYRGEFEQALKEALDRVSDRERIMLRMHLVNGLSVEAIGKMFGVTQPTASRWLARAREALLDDIKAALATRLGVSSEELASLAGLVASGFDMNLSQALKTR